MYYSGLLNRSSYYSIAKKNLILMYHMVVKSPVNFGISLQPGMYVTEKTFEEHMVFLKKTFSIIPLSEILGRISKGQSIR